MTPDAVKEAASLLEAIKQLGLARASVSVYCGVTSLEEMLDAEACARIDAAITAEFQNAIDRLTERLAHAGVATGHLLPLVGHARDSAAESAGR